MPTPPNASRADIIARLHAGHSNARISRELRCDKHRVAAIRNELGLPVFVPVEQTRTLEEKWALDTRPVEGGHIEWTGERATGGTPLVSYKEKHHSAAAVAFHIKHGRDPEGYAFADCGMKHCVAPDHVDDEAGRLAKRQELRRANGLGDQPNTCPYHHDQSVHGRLQQDGRPYCKACKREQKTEPEAQREARASARQAVRRNIEAMLRKGIPQMHIARQLGVAPATVQRTREALGLPARRSGPPDRYGSLEEAFRANTKPLDGGHLRWTGYPDSGRGTPYVCFRQQRVTAARVSFELHHGRPPVGPVLPGCRVGGCLAGEHLEDRPLRDKKRQQERQAKQREKQLDRLFVGIFGGTA